MSTRKQGNAVALADSKPTAASVLIDLEIDLFDLFRGIRLARVALMSDQDNANEPTLFPIAFELVEDQAERLKQKWHDECAKAGAGIGLTTSAGRPALPRVKSACLTLERALETIPI
jgi:hypothetical protein